MSEGMQIMTTIIVGCLAVAVSITVSVVETNRAWERVATECVSAGGSWAVVARPGTSAADWACTR